MKKFTILLLLGILCLSCRPQATSNYEKEDPQNIFLRQDVQDTLISFLESRKLVDEEVSFDYLEICFSKTQEDTLLRFLLSDDVAFTVDSTPVGSLHYHDCEVTLVFHGAINTIDCVNDSLFDKRHYDSLLLSNSEIDIVHGIMRLYKYSSLSHLELIDEHRYNL